MLPFKVLAHRIRFYIVGFTLAALLATGGFAGNPGFAATINVPTKGTSKTVDQIRAQGELRAAVAISLPWLGQNPKDGKFFGPAIDIGDRVAKLLGVKLTLITSTWDVIVAGLQSNKYDVTLAPLFATKKRLQVVDFVNYGEDGFCYVALKSNGTLNTLADIDHPTVSIGVFVGSAEDQVMRTRFPKAKIDAIVQSVTGSTRIQDVLSRRISVTTIGAFEGVVVAHKYPQMKIIPGGVQYCRQHPDVPTPVGMALNYGDPVYKKFLAAVVADMHDQIKASVVKYNSLEYMLESK